MTPVSAGSVEERPNPRPGDISEITIVPFMGPDEPLMKTRDVTVTKSEVISTRVGPFNSTLPETTTDISIDSILQ